MAMTDAQICNIALLRVGELQTLDSLDEDNQAARVCKAIFASSRDAVLAEVDWKFARRRAVLAQLADQAERPEWAYIFSLPTDCIAARSIDDASSPQRRPSEETRVPFDIELNDAATAKVLVCDLETPVLFYTSRVTNSAMFEPLFIQALAWCLASDLALALSKKPQVGLAMQGGFRAALAHASVASLRQAQNDLPALPSFISGR